MHIEESFKKTSEFLTKVKEKFDSETMLLIIDWLRAKENSNKFLRFYLGRIIGSTLINENLIDYDDYLEYAKEWDYTKNLPEDEIAAFIVRNAREPKQCPHCGEYLPGPYNYEIWLR